MMSYLSPKNRHNLTFGYFGLAERASSFVGPIVWGLIATNLTSFGPNRYRVAIAVLTIFVVMGLVAMKYVKSDKVKMVSK
ncbi:MAG: hypothetical protein FD167_4516 [bacterium]|nr:MAG: hypothetical protein FD167_4516 [bacterium]